MAMAIAMPETVHEERAASELRKNDLVCVPDEPGGPMKIIAISTPFGVRSVFEITVKSLTGVSVRCIYRSANEKLRIVR